MTGLQINRFSLVTGDRAPYIAWVLSQMSRKATATPRARRTKTRSRDGAHAWREWFPHSFMVFPT
jgi:hypothetical protein